jgi:peptide deformylase
MSILKIAKMGHPVLKARAQEVPDPTAPEIQFLVRDMVETMIDAPGTGLAAPQVHVAKRVVTYMVSAARAGQDGGDEVPLTVLVNPVIEPLGDKVVEDWEACLSVPGLRGLVPRFEHIGFRAFDLKGQLVEREVHGFHARVVQHECDHLDGILYPQRMTNLGSLIFDSEFRHITAEAAEAGDKQ